MGPKRRVYESWIFQHSTINDHQHHRCSVLLLLLLLLLLSATTHPNASLLKKSQELEVAFQVVVTQISFLNQRKEDKIVLFNQNINNERFTNNLCKKWPIY